MSEVTGVDAAIKILNQYPNKIKKEVRASMRFAGNKLKRKIINNSPASVKKIVKTKVKLGKDTSAITVGMFRKSNAELYDKALWLNYGTLEGRDPNHKFLKPINKNITHRGTGVQHRNFYDEAVAGAEESLQKNFITDLERRAKKLENG